MSDELEIERIHDYPAIKCSSYISGFKDCYDLISKELRACGFTDNDIRVSVFHARLRLHRLVDF